MSNKITDKTDGQRMQVYLYFEDRAKLAHLKDKLGLGVSPALQLILDEADVQAISRRVIHDTIQPEFEK